MSVLQGFQKLQRTNFLVRVLYFVAVVGCISTHTPDTYAACSIVISSNTTTSVSDTGQANCNITIDDGIALTTTGTQAVFITGNGSSLINNGTISTIATGYSVIVSTSGTSSITNTGIINPGTATAIMNFRGQMTFFNSGTITSTGSYSISNRSTISSFINTGTISTSADWLSGLMNDPRGSITTLTNYGVMSGGLNGAGIRNDSSTGIETLNNSQGGDGSSAEKTALTLYWRLPSYYNIIVTSPTRYGQLSVNSPQSSTIFGIYSGGIAGVPASTLSAGTYSSVLTGVTASNITGSTSGIYGSYSWMLSNVTGTTWDLIVARICLASGGVVSSGEIINSTCSLSSGSLTVDGPSSTSAAGTISVATGTSTAGTAVYNTGALSGITNRGIITSTSVLANAAIENATSSTITNLENTASGTILGTNGIWNRSRITTLNNSGTITGTKSGNAGGIYIGSNGVITTLINSGTISNANGYGIYNNSNGTVGIGTLTNTGNISGGLFGINNTDVGGINTLNNQQGSSGSPLTLTGKLPTNYNIIIASTSNYGQLAAGMTTGVTRFGISSLSTTSASIFNISFASVLSGITPEQLGYPGATSFSGVSNGYSYILSLSNMASNIWGLIITGCTSCNNSINTGMSVPLSAVGVTVNPVLDGGTLVLYNNDSSSQTFTVAATSTIMTPTAGNAKLSGVFSGPAGLTIDGTGTVVLSGDNTYSGGTTVKSGTLSIDGSSPTGTGDVFIAAGGTLTGRGVILGRLYVAGTFKPGNSPGYLSTSSTFTMNTGSTYQQDIAGTIQATDTSPVGSSGYYSFLNVKNGQFVIQPGATLAPRLSNLFTTDQAGYGSAIYVPSLGERFRIVTAEDGISGKFTTLTQPAELAAGTQFLPFYNMAGSNSLELAVIPTSYPTTVASASGNANAQSVGGALTQIAQSSLIGSSTFVQDQLLYSISDQTSAKDIATFAQALAGEVYAATVGVIAQTTQRIQQTILSRLGDTAGLVMTSPTPSPISSLTIQAGGAPTADVSSNPAVTPDTDTRSFSSGNVWGDLAYQRGNRASDKQSGGWNSNLYQLTFGSDFYSSNGTTLGGGVALSSTTLNPVYGSATIQQGTLFAYGKVPVDTFVLDAIASIGLSSSDISRGDITGLSTGYRKKSVSGNDAMISLGLSRPLDLDDSLRITPYARVTWQMVTQSGVNEGSAGSALSVDRFIGNGVRGVIGVAAGSKASNPFTSQLTYRAYLGIGVDSPGLLNPTLNASLAGFGTSITTPDAGRAFVQAGLYGTAKLSEHTFAYMGVSGETRSGQTLGTINIGLKVQF